MRKKHIVILLLTVGVSLLLLSVILSFITTANANIIGGAGWPTFWFVFRCGRGGLFLNLARLGMVGIIASVVVGLIKKKSDLGE